MGRDRFSELRVVRSQDARLERYLLELILIDSLAVRDSRRACRAEQVIDRTIPPRWYERVLDRYDHLSGDDDQGDVLHAWLPKAAQKDSRWKSKMILRFLNIVASDSPVTSRDLADVAALAEAMGAGRERRRLFARTFGPGFLR